MMSMRATATACLLAALVCFAAFSANVALGAARKPVLLGDISEMLLLLLAVTLFVAGTLAREMIATASKEGAVHSPSFDDA